jgi:hypothetical protein
MSWNNLVVHILLVLLYLFIYFIYFFYNRVVRVIWGHPDLIPETLCKEPLSQGSGKAWAFARKHGSKKLFVL